MRPLTLFALAGCTGLSPNANSRLHGEDDKQAIVGGAEAEPGQFPHQVSIRVGGEHVCSGSVIASRFVLTSADCVAFYESSDISLELDATRLGAGRSVSVDEILIHPDYDRSTGAHDIALVETWGLWDGIDPIRLVAADIEADHADVGDEAVVSGWGAVVEQGRNQRDLQFASVLVQDPGVCSVLNGVETGDRICAGVPSVNGGTGTCEGDQGGPLAVSVGDTWALAGVVNGGSACASSIPLNARVSSHTDWILSHANAEFANPGPEDHGDTLADATVLSVDLTASAMGELRWGDTDVFALDVPEARDLVVIGYSTEFFDIDVVDQDGNVLDSVTSFSTDVNVPWRMEVPRVEGAVYLQVTGSYRLQRGHYDFTVEGTPIPEDEHGNTTSDATPVAFGQVVPSYMNYEDVDVFSFETTETVDVLMYTTGDTDTYGELITDGVIVDYAYYGGDGPNFQLHATVAPGVHHVWVEGRYESEAGVGAYDFQVIVVPSDVGDTIETAAPLPLDVPTAGFLVVGDDDYFEINVPTDGFLQLGTSGESDTIGTLYNSDGVYLTQNYGVDDAGNFFIVREVTAGTYFVEVSSNYGGLYDVWATWLPQLP